MQRKWVQLYREQGVSTAHSSVSTLGGVQGQELDFDDPFQLRIIQNSDSLLIFVVGHSNNSPDQTGTTQFRGQGARKSLTICFYKREWRVVSVLIQPGVQPGLGPKAPSPAAKGAAETMKSPLKRQHQVQRRTRELKSRHKCRARAQSPRFVPRALQGAATAAESQPDVPGTPALPDSHEHLSHPPLARLLLAAKSKKQPCLCSNCWTSECLLKIKKKGSHGNSCI